MRLLKLTLKRQPQNYTSPGLYYGSARQHHFRYTADCQYELQNGNGLNILNFCATQFHAATGFKLAPSEERRIEIEIKEVA